MACLLFRAIYSYYRVYKYFLQLKFCNPSVYPNLLLNPNTPCLLKIFFLWREAIFYRRYLGPLQFSFFSGLVMDLMFYFAMKQTYPGPRVSLIECWKKAPSHSLFSRAHWTLENKQSLVVHMGLHSHGERKGKWSKWNKGDERNKRNKQTDPPLDVIYNDYCFDKFFILKVNLKTWANL